jgi:hypothetical protein
MLKTICLKCRRQFKGERRCCNNVLTIPLMDFSQVIVGPGWVIDIPPGSAFNVRLPDGTMLNVEQTADDFSITTIDGTVCYSRPTSEMAKQSDGQDDDREVVSGKG